MATGNQTLGSTAGVAICSYGPVFGHAMGVCKKHSLTDFICREVNGIWVKVCEKCEAENKLRQEDE